LQQLRYNVNEDTTSLRTINIQLEINAKNTTTSRRSCLSRWIIIIVCAHEKFHAELIRKILYHLHFARRPHQYLYALTTGGKIAFFAFLFLNYSSEQCTLMVVKGEPATR
jgi:hypothetical protein